MAPSCVSVSVLYTLSLDNYITGKPSVKMDLEFEL